LTNETPRDYARRQRTPVRQVLDSLSVTAVGKRVRALREARNLTQRTLADLAGLYHTTISELELGKTVPSIQTLDRIAKALGVDTGDLLSNGSNNGTHE
jgi:transcriptional regulator with XRE-family HTH domain